MILISEYSAKLIQLWGEYLGCGKTLTAVEYAYREYLQTGNQVYSNIHLSFSKFPPEPSEIILMRRRRNAILVLDELYQTLEARGSESGSNQGLTQEISMNRKRGNTIYATSPDVTMVDKRFRNIADFTIKTEREGPLNDRDTIIRQHIFAKNMKNVSGLEHETDWMVVGDTCDLYDTKEEVQADRMAYIEGMATVIRQRKDRHGNSIYEKLQKSNLTLQKAYLKSIFYVNSSSDQILVLDQLALL